MKLNLEGEPHDARLGNAGWEVDGVATQLHGFTRRTRGASVQYDGWHGSRRVRWWATPAEDGSWIITAPGGQRHVLSSDLGPNVSNSPLGPLKCPMAGTLTGLSVTIGQLVEAGQDLAVIEAMKMRYVVTAAGKGVVTELVVAVGARVVVGQTLLILTSET